MQEIVNQLLVTGQGMLRYRWHALLFAWFIAVIGWAGVMILPDNYEARAKVYVDTDTVLRPLLKGLAAENDVITEVTMMSRALLAQPQGRFAPVLGGHDREHDVASLESFMEKG